MPAKKTPVAPVAPVKPARVPDEPIKMNEAISLKNAEGGMRTLTIRHLFLLARDTPGMLDMPLTFSDPEGNDICNVQALCLSTDERGTPVAWVYGDTRGL